MQGLDKGRIHGAGRLLKKGKHVSRGCYALRTLGSRNGTTVNGVRVEEAFLKDGDLIGASRTQMRLNVLNGQLSPPLTDLVCQICAIRPSPATIPLASLSATSYLCPACRE